MPINDADIAWIRTVAASPQPEDLTRLRVLRRRAGEAATRRLIDSILQKDSHARWAAERERREATRREYLESRLAPEAQERIARQQAVGEERLARAFRTGRERMRPVDAEARAAAIMREGAGAVEGLLQEELA